MDLSKCGCEKAGFCPFFCREMDSKNHHWCKNTTEEKRERYYTQNQNKFETKNPIQLMEQVFDLPQEYSIPEQINEIEIITFHFNPTKSKRLKETYYEFMHSLKNLAKYIKCYELVFDQNEPEIKNSIVIKGTVEKNCLWQKEALVNLAFKNTPKNKKYFFWIDHDLISCNKNFLSDAMHKLENQTDFVQLFCKVGYLDQGLVKNIHQVIGRVNSIKNNRYIKKRNQNGAPGGAWIAKVEKMKKIYPLPNIMTGSGDEWFMYGLDKNYDYMQTTLANYPSQCRVLLDKFRDRVSKIDIKYDYIENPMLHLWHGDIKNRQYQTRHKIVTDNELDIFKDLFINKEGIMEVVNSKAKICKDVFKYFENRKEDS